MNFDLSVEALKRCLNKDRRRAAMEALRAPFFGDEAEAQCFRAWVRSQGGPLKFAYSLVGKEEVDFLREYIKECRLDPDSGQPSFLELVLGKKVSDSSSDGPSAAFLAVFETEVARKEYKQTLSLPERQVTEIVNGVLKTSVLPAEPERVVESYEFESEDRESRRIIPYFRDEHGNAISQGALKRSLGIPTVRDLLDGAQDDTSREYLLKSLEYDNRPVLEMFIISKDLRVALAPSTILRMRETHRQLRLVSQEAKQSYVAAKESGDREAKRAAWVAYQEAYIKTDKQLRLCKELESAVYRFKMGQLPEEPVLHRMDIGHLTKIQGPWPLFVTTPILGGHRLAVRCLKSDLTKEGYEVRRKQYAAWKESPEGQAMLAAARKAWLKTPEGLRWLEAKRSEMEQQTRPCYGDIPMI